jgi:hypothetical protein
MDVKKRIEEVIQQEIEKSKERVRSGKFSPSSMGRCYRYQYWNRKDEEQTNPPNIYAFKKFRIGNIVHDDIQSMFPEEMVEVEISSDDISGKADLVDEYSVVDLKTISSFQWKRIDKPDVDIARDYPTYVMQLMTYVYFLKKELGQLVFISKDTLETLTFEFKASEWNMVVEEELDLLRAMWRLQDLPRAIPRAYVNAKGESQEGRYCVFRDKCLSLGWDCVKHKKVSTTEGGEL